jgi:hypothetical protein
MTDTGAYTDTIFGIFHLLGYQFSPFGRCSSSDNGAHLSDRRRRRSRSGP